MNLDWNLWLSCEEKSDTNWVLTLRWVERKIPQFHRILNGTGWHQKLFQPFYPLLAINDSIGRFVVFLSQLHTDWVQKSAQLCDVTLVKSTWLNSTAASHVVDVWTHLKPHWSGPKEIFSTSFQLCGSSLDHFTFVLDEKKAESLRILSQ